MKSVYTYEFKLLSALYKVFPEEEPQEDFSVPLTALQNETVSFQAAYKIPSPGEGCLRVAVESPISGRVRLRTVEPVSYTHLDVYKRQATPRFSAAMAYQGLRSTCSMERSRRKTGRSLRLFTARAAARKSQRPI